MCFNADSATARPDRHTTMLAVCMDFAPYRTNAHARRPATRTVASPHERGAVVSRLWVSKRAPYSPRSTCDLCLRLCSALPTRRTPSFYRLIPRGGESESERRDRRPRPLARPSSSRPPICRRNSLPLRPSARPPVCPSVTLNRDRKNGPRVGFSTANAGRVCD